MISTTIFVEENSEGGQSTEEHEEAETDCGAMEGDVQIGEQSCSERDSGSDEDEDEELQEHVAPEMALEIMMLYM